MKVAVMCKTCTTGEPHIDHYECDTCGKHLHGMTDCGGCRGTDRRMRYCPFCGTPLEDTVTVQQQKLSELLLGIEAGLEDFAAAMNSLAKGLK